MCIFMQQQLQEWKVLWVLEGRKPCKYVTPSENTKRLRRKPPLCRDPRLPCSSRNCSTRLTVSRTYSALYLHFNFYIFFSPLTEWWRSLSSKGQQAGPRTGKNGFQHVLAAGPTTLPVPVWLRASPQAIVTRKWSSIAFILWLQMAARVAAEGGRHTSADRCWPGGQSNVKKRERDCVTTLISATGAAWLLF